MDQELRELENNMKKRMLIILIGMLIIGSAFTGIVYAQDKPMKAREMHMIREECNLSDDHEFALVCSGEITHPVLMDLAETYAVDYEDLLAYFCEDEFGVGEIRLALITAEREGVDLTYEEILAMRLEDGIKEVGWGLIWQELGLIGRARQNRGQEMGSEEMNNKPEIPPGLRGTHPGRGIGPKK
jgi:hypothetical protein